MGYTKDMKLGILKSIRARIKEKAKTDLMFICGEYTDVTDGPHGMSGCMEMATNFPELHEEIVRTGLQENPKFGLPNALKFRDVDGQLVSNITGEGKYNYRWYNRKKLELLNRVEDALKKSDKQQSDE